MARTKGALGKKTIAKLESMKDGGNQIIPTNESNNDSNVVIVKRKRGRPPGSKNKTIFNNPSIKNKPERIIQEYHTNIHKVEHIKNLSGRYIANFTGDNYLHSLTIAEAWAKENNFLIVDYYEQIAHNKSVLISYR